MESGIQTATQGRYYWVRFKRAFIWEKLRDAYGHDIAEIVRVCPVQGRPYYEANKLCGCPRQLFGESRAIHSLKEARAEAFRLVWWDAVTHR